jgi:TatD DNase family protein
MLFDAHSHVNEDRFSDRQRGDLIREIDQNERLGYVIDVGFDMPSSELACQDAHRSEKIYAAIGVHPHDADTLTRESLERLQVLAKDKRVVAVGEIGLDYHYMRSSREDQMRAFRSQIRLANDLKMPIVVHSREAGPDTMRILQEEEAFSKRRKRLFPERPGPDGKPVPDARVYIHCFSESSEVASEYIKLGATIGICGPLTFKNNKKTVRLVAEHPMCFMMAETDSPYLAPEPMRGKENKPWYVEYTIKKIAEIKGMEPEKAEQILTDNSKRFYRI